MATPGPMATGSGLGMQARASPPRPAATDAFARPEVEEVSASTARANVPSRRLLERLGFQPSRETTAAMGPDGAPLEFGRLSLPARAAALRAPHCGG